MTKRLPRSLPAPYPAPGLPERFVPEAEELAEYRNESSQAENLDILELSLD